MVCVSVSLRARNNRPATRYFHSTSELKHKSSPRPFPPPAVPPKILDANTSRDTEVREGGAARLVCSASGQPQPTYKWRREDSKVIGISGGHGKYLATEHLAS